MKTFLLALSLLGMWSLEARTAPAPPFGSSITWNTSKESPSLDALHGKAVLVVFFQSWCPLCNNWSGEMFKSITEHFKDQPEVVLIALKTDGGSVRDALEYLEGRMDVDRWLVGTDTNATYARQATGVDRLYTYAWITPEGEIGESGKAGTTVSGSSPKRYWATRDAAREQFLSSAKPLLDPGLTVPEALLPVAHLAEQGLFASALRELQPLAGKPELTEAATSLRSSIAAAVQGSIDRHVAALASSEKSDRYFSYLALLDIEARFANSTFARAAVEATAPHANSDWVRQEEEAHRAYDSLMRKASRADDKRSIERVTKSLQEFGSAHADTVFGRIAAAATDSED